MATLQHGAVLADECKSALLGAKLRALLDADLRPLGRPAEGGEACNVTIERHGVVAPVTGGDHSAVKVENPLQLASIEGGGLLPIPWPREGRDDAQALFTLLL